MSLQRCFFELLRRDKESISLGHQSSSCLLTMSEILARLKSVTEDGSDPSNTFTAMRRNEGRRRRVNCILKKHIG